MEAAQSLDLRRLGSDISLDAILSIHSGGGDDKLFGGMSEDRLYGDDGNDQISGGDGNDILSGGGGDDSVIGNRGDDRLFADGGFDVLTGGKGADVFHLSGEATVRLADFNVLEGDSIVLDDIEGRVVFSIARNSKDFKRLKRGEFKNKGSVNFIYRPDKAYALWSPDNDDSFQKIFFDTLVPSSELKKSIFESQSGAFIGSEIYDQMPESSGLAPMA